MQFFFNIIVYNTCINVCANFFFIIMNTLLITGTIMVTFALICYTLAIIFEQRKHILTRMFAAFLFTGFIFDFISTLFMISGSKNGPFTIHGLIGYTSLLGMFFACVLILRILKANGFHNQISRKIHVYTNIAYIWWVISYITGAIIGMSHKF